MPGDGGPCTPIDGGPCTPGAVLKELQLGASSTLGADSDDRILGFELMQSGGTCFACGRDMNPWGWAVTGSL